MTLQDWHTALLALTIWREAEGEPYVGKIAVGCSIRNRVHDSLTPNNWNGVMTRRLQYSSLTALGDPRTVAWPPDAEQAWLDSLAVAEGVIDGTIADNTFGATNYCNLSVVTPSWAQYMTKTVTIGHHTFFK